MTASTDVTAVLDLAVRKGAMMSKVIQIQTNGAIVALPVGTTAKMQIRSQPGSAVVLAELSTSDGSLVVDANTAQVTINMKSAATAAFTFERAVYDLNLYYPPDNEKDCIVEGKVFAFPSVTQ